MTIGDYFMIGAVLISPILAVQVQKAIELWKESKQRKIAIFKILMTTRGSPMSFRHVEALNMIDIEFSLKKPEEKKVIESWKIYLDHLHSPRIESDDIDHKVKIEQWGAKTNSLLADLLQAMGLCLKYDFDKVHLMRGAYSPQGHVNAWMDQDVIRTSVVQLLKGEKSLPVDIRSSKDQHKEGKEALND